jgi:IclR family acetate operon transcriptional repressor
MAARPAAHKTSIAARKNASEEKDPYFSRATSKAFELLDALDGDDRPWTLNELSAEIKLTKSSTFRLLHTLEELHRIRRNEQGNYQRASRVDSSLRPEAFAQRLREAAVEPMRRLSMEFRETVSLAALMGNHIEVVAALDSPHLVRMANVVGRILPPHASSMGKAITAFQGNELRERLIVSYGMTLFTPNTISDQRQLEEYFEKIRSTGISCDDEENTLGGVCYGVPIYAPGRQVLSAISLSMPISRLPKEPSGVEAILSELKHAASLIAETLEAAR